MFVQHVDQSSGSAVELNTGSKQSRELNVQRNPCSVVTTWRISTRRFYKLKLFLTSIDKLIKNSVFEAVYYIFMYNT